jgi:signal transduction histidine kinase/ActR/RegA family two-component response regulator
MKTAGYVAATIAAGSGLWLTSAHSYLLFHALVELFRVGVAGAMFAVAWNSRRFSRNGYLTHIGIAYLFVASLDLLHTLAYRGMGVFTGFDTDLPTQLWIAARGMESISLLLSPVFVVRRLWPRLTLAAYLVATALLLVVIFPLDAFPVCYVEGTSHPGLPPGLTAFKVNAEYLICLIFLASLVALWAVRERVSERALPLMVAAVVTSIFSELAFTRYVNVYGDFNMAGHLLKAASFFLIYKAMVQDTLTHPYEALFRDLEEQKARLADANRMKDEFLATLSHELRTPLNAVVGWSQMLLGGRLDEAGTRRAIEVIDRSARAQVALINDVLDVSRIISGKLRIDARPMDVCDCLQAALDSARPAAEAKGIEVVRTVDGPAVIAGDPDRVQQIVWNLLSNAIKFTPKGGRIDVSVGRHDGDVELRVRDNGVGIAADAIPHLFERFWQADRSPGRQHAGLGLGLAIVRHLVELHGGNVRAESLGLGRGATFIVELPVRAVATELAPPAKPAAEEQHPEAAPQRRPLDGVSVLVCDDEVDARELLSAVLTQAGAKVEAVESASAAVEAVRAHQPNVIVSDIGMPLEDGYSLMRRVRALPPSGGGSIPAVALTAYATKADVAKAMDAGFQEHVAKPVDPDMLVEKVANVTHAHSNVA